MAIEPVALRDLSSGPLRTTTVWRFTLVSLLAAASLITAIPVGGSGATMGREATGAGLSVRVPVGWHLIGRRLTDVVEPAQRLAVATFDVRLASHPCECGEPNVRNFPRTGAFVFIWEYRERLSRAQLSRVPRRPASFHVTQDNRHWFECAGPSWTAGFRDAGRVFQVEVYLGPGAGRNVRLRMDALLDSLRVARLPVR